MIKSLRVSIGRTWRFATPGNQQVTASVDATAYRALLGQLRSGASPTAWSLPWPPYPSMLWSYMLGVQYQQVRNTALVGALLPLRYEGGPDASAETQAEVTIEALLHPFALTAMVHVRCADTETFEDEGSAGERLDTLLREMVPALGSPIRAGIPLDQIPDLPESDADGHAAGFEEVGQFRLLSARHDSTVDPLPLAYRLASCFEKTASDKSAAMNTDGTAIGISGRNVGLLMPTRQARSDSRIRCLHQNQSTLLAYLANLVVLPPAAPTAATQFFRTQSATVLNALSRRTALDATGTIYKSRLAELWIANNGDVAAINQVTDASPVPPPTLPEP